MRKNCLNQQGFSSVEILLALLVFSIVICLTSSFTTALLLSSQRDISRLQMDLFSYSFSEKIKLLPDKNLSDITIQQENVMKKCWPDIHIRTVYVDQKTCRVYFQSALLKLERIFDVEF